MNMDARYISAKDIANKYGFSYSLINYYTNLGLFEVRRRDGNVRLYDDEEIHERKEEVSRLIDRGYPLRMIRDKIKNNVSVL